jgi:hypothetical protein
VVAAALAWANAVAWAAHPLVTEDTATQGEGNAELEKGFSWSHDGEADVRLFQPQLSWGLSPALDVIVQPAWVSRRTLGGERVSGWGDTRLDAKWRFFGEAPWSLAVRAGVTLPTAQGDLGLPHGTASPHAVLVATYEQVPFALHMNLGVANLPRGTFERSNQGHVSAALMWSANERWVWTLDVDADANPDPARSAWQGTALAGLVYTVQPGLDVDFGYQSTLRHTTLARQWLLGLTYRFAP